MYKRQTYILNQVKKSGCCGFSDDEIFGMALHYYQEDNIEVGSPLKCNVGCKTVSGILQSQAGLVAFLDAVRMLVVLFLLGIEKVMVQPVSYTHLNGA